MPPGLFFVEATTGSRSKHASPLRDSLMPLTLCGSIYIKVWPAYFAGSTPTWGHQFSPHLIRWPSLPAPGLASPGRMWIATRSPPSTGK